MFAARANQENAVYEQQTAAASKTQGIRGLAPKTPANKTTKTHSKFPLNNENATAQTMGKLAGKTGVVERNSFVTPAGKDSSRNSSYSCKLEVDSIAGPRNRAPLGNKTTNAKALQTPAAPETQDRVSSTKPSSPRLRRSRIKIHETASIEVNDIPCEPEEREIEYMPPREVPLPDYPDEIWPHDRTYPQLEGNNLTRGWFSVYASAKSGDADERETSDFEELCRKAEAKTTRHAPKGVNTKDAPSHLNLNATAAAAALASKPLKHSGFAAPTVATTARQNRTTLSNKLGNKPAPVLGNPRFAAAKAASKSTIGYSKGRAVSASSKMPLSDIHSAPDTLFDPNFRAYKRPTLEDLLRLSVLDGGDNDSLDADMESTAEDDESMEDFQLDVEG